MYGVDLVGVGFVKNNPTATGGPGGHLAPLAHSIKSVGELGDQYCKQNVVQYNPLSNVKELVGQLPLRSNSLAPSEKTKNTPKSAKTQKKHKNRQNDVIFTGMVCPKN